MNNVLSPKWEGDFATPLDAASIRFKIAPAPIRGACSGCLFLGQRNAVCEQANAIVVAAGGIDCDKEMPNGQSVIYVACEVDPRQLEIEVAVKSEQESGATGSRSDIKKTN